jgi:hypothetical protein
MGISKGKNSMNKVPGKNDGGTRIQYGKRNLPHIAQRAQNKNGRK